MSRTSSKELCLWLIRPNDGRVTKVRLTLKRFLVLGSGLALIALLFMFVLGDYTRVQLVRANDFFNLKVMTYERNQLLSKNNSLEQELNRLKATNSQAISYEQQLKDRLKKLSSLIESAIPLKSMDKAVTKKEESQGGIGGAELDCVSGAGVQRCASQVNSEMRASLMPFDSKRNPGSNLGLMHNVENLISVLRRMPLGAPVEGPINSGFGPRVSPFSGRVKMHAGADFSVSRGSPVYATGDGIVKSVKRTSTYGLVVDIAHSENVVSRYAHLSKSTVAIGEEIKRGEKLGLVGSSGRATGPHLHYEVRHNYSALNPKRFIELAKKLQGII